MLKYCFLKHNNCTHTFKCLIIVSYIQPEEVRHISVFSIRRQASHQCCADWELRSADGTSHLLHSSLRCSGYSAWSTSQTSCTWPLQPRNGKRQNSFNLGSLKCSMNYIHIHCQWLSRKKKMPLPVHIIIYVGQVSFFIF